MVKETKRTFTYSGRPSIRTKAAKKAKKEGVTLSEKIDFLLEEYSCSNGRIYAVWAIDWTEFERGWGSRPDGTSLHLSKEEADNVVKKDAKSKEGTPVPDEYSSPGRPYLKEVKKEVYDILISKGAYRM